MKTPHPRPQCSFAPSSARVMVPRSAQHPAGPSLAALLGPRARPSPGAVRSRTGAALGMIPVRRTLGAAAASSYLPLRGCPRGRAVPCCARLPRAHTAHVMPEEIGSALGRKLKQRAPRCWSTPHPRAPRGTPAPRPSRLPEPTSRPSAGLPGHPGGTPRLPAPDGHRGQTHWTPCAGIALPASAVGEGLGEGGTGGHRALGPQAGTAGTAEPHRALCLPWPPPAWSPHPPSPALGRAGPSVPPRGVGVGPARQGCGGSEEPGPVQSGARHHGRTAAGPG